MNEADAAREAALDATIRAAREIVGAGERLMTEAEAGQKAFAEWKASNGVTDDTNTKFLAKLSPEALKQYKDEQERQAIQDKHDQEAALEQAGTAKPVAVPKRRRNMA